MKIIIGCLFIILTTTTFSQDGKVVYEYKKYQKFDFEDLSLSGDIGSPGDISISPRYQLKFKNKLPYRKNFNPEIVKGVERVR